jgi:hypothetical protein
LQGIEPRARATSITKVRVLGISLVISMGLKSGTAHARL